jgi:DNA repair protein RadD
VSISPGKPCRLSRRYLSQPVIWSTALMMDLWPHQARGIDAVRASLQRLPDNSRRIVVVSPTGSGKTRFGAELARLKTGYAGRVLWLAHRTELIDQSATALEAQELAVGVVAAGSQRRPNPHCLVQVASLQTLLARDQKPPADLIVFDEVHHAAARQAMEFLQGYPNAQVVGLTATPQRGDGRPLDWFADMVVLASMRELVDGGFLVDCDVIAPDEALRPGEIAREPWEAYDAHAPGQSAIVFSPTIAEAEKHAAGFGGRAVMIEGATGRAERRRALSEFKEGRLRVLVNVGVLTEGTDLPICSCVVLARGCGTEGLYLQITGRALRRYPGKTRATLIDLRGVSHVHGHPTEDRVYSLEGSGISRGNAEPNPYPACRVCGAPVSPGEGCAECGTGVNTAKPLVVTGHVLSKWEHMRRRGDSERAVSLAKWLRVASEKGWKAGAVAWKYKAVFGGWPPGAVMAEAKRINEGRE